VHIGHRPYCFAVFSSSSLKFPQARIPGDGPAVVVESVGCGKPRPETGADGPMTVDAGKGPLPGSSIEHPISPLKNYKAGPRTGCSDLRRIRLRTGHAEEVPNLSPKVVRYADGHAASGQSGTPTLATGWEALIAGTGKPGRRARRDSIGEAGTRGLIPTDGFPLLAFDAAGTSTSHGRNLGAPYTVAGSDGTPIRTRRAGKVLFFPVVKTRRERTRQGRGPALPVGIALPSVLDTYGRLFHRLITSPPTRGRPCRFGVHVVARDERRGFL